MNAYGDDEGGSERGAVGILFLNADASSHGQQKRPKLDEQRDRRRVRRPISDEELGRLLEAARPAGRMLRYLTAALAGMRKGELLALTWGDVDFEAGVLTVQNSKAGSVDQVPLHPQLATGTSM